MLASPSPSACTACAARAARPVDADISWRVEASQARVGVVLESSGTIIIIITTTIISIIRVVSSHGFWQRGGFAIAASGHAMDTEQRYFLRCASVEEARDVAR